MKNRELYYGIICIVVIIFAIHFKEQRNNLQKELESYKHPKVTIEKTDTCNHQGEILHYNVIVLVDGKSYYRTLKIGLNDTILDELRYGDGYYKTTLKKLIK